MTSHLSQWREPIAIVSMACRLPGGIDKPSDLWDHVRAGRSSATAIPKDRFNAENFLSRDPNQKGAQAFRGAHFVTRDIKQFDHKFFGISKDTATAMDPQQKQLLEVVYECLESANVSLEKISNSKIGCYCAMFVSDYHDMLMQDPEYLPTFIAIGTTRTMLANRISHALDLGGPSVTIDTACSGSLVALHLACQALQAGECDGAVIGASNLFLAPDYALSLTRLGAIAADGQCKTFDASADGYGRGEGTNAVYVKRLSDAIRDGDNIRAVIRGTSSNSSGATPAITEPSGRAQKDTILQAYAQAGITDLGETGYFECHGTGTPVGDCIELGAVGSVFAASQNPQNALWVGSTKPNVGHSESASGLTGLIKVVLALEKGEIPPNTNYKTPNPKIDFEGWRVRVPTSPQPWPSKSVRRASVNSLGIGGSTAHAVVEFYEPPGITNGSVHEINGINGVDTGEQANKPFFLLFTSGASRSSRDKNALNLLQFLRRHDECHSLTGPLIKALNFRSQIHVRPWKSYAVAQTVDDLIQQLENNALKSNNTPSSGDAPRILFTFTGQGAIWPQMGKRLLEAFPVARNTLYNLEHIVGELQSSNKPTWSLIEKLTAELSQKEINSPTLAHPLSIAVQIALIDVLSSWGVLPDGVVGHSGGETAAAYACGALTAREAITVAYYRGIACENAPSGAMLAVRSAPKAKLLQVALERNDVQIACFNGPQNLTLAGSVEGIQNVAAELSSYGIVSRAVAVTRAYHTYTMKSVVDNYIGHLRGVLYPKAARVPMYSSVSGLELNGTEVDADYWVANLVSPVLYTDAVLLAMTQVDRKFDLCVELGPHSLLSRPTSEILKSLARSPQLPYFPTMIRNADSSQQLMSLAGELILNGKQLSLEQINKASFEVAGKSGRLSNDLQDNLPPYAWDHSSTPWAEPRNSLEWRFRKSPRHEILGTRCRGENPSTHTWRNKVSIGDAPWLVDHQVNGIVTFSFTTGIAMVVEAMMQVQEEAKEIEWANHSFEFEDFVFSNSIILPDETPIDLFLTLIPEHDNTKCGETWYDFIISSLRGDVDIRHCYGKAAVVETGKDDDTILRNTSWHHMPLKVPLKSYYKTLEKVGYGYGPKFQLLSEVRVRPGLSACSAKIDMTSATGSPTRGQRYFLHPAMMDAALQTPALANRSGYFQEIDTLLLPSRMKRISIRMPAESTEIASCATHTLPVGFSRLEGNVKCYDALSKPFFVVEGLQMDRAARDDQTTLPWLRLIWKPDIGDILSSGPTLSSIQIKSLPAEEKLVNLENLVKELIPLIVENGIENRKDLVSHLQMYRSWLLGQADLHKERLSVRHQLENGSTKLQDAISSVVSNSGISHTVDASIVSKLAINMGKIFRGEVEALAVWLEDDLLHRFYEESIFTTSMNQKLRSVAELLAHKNPDMKILEIGAGTGGATTELLRGFSRAGGPNAYQSFTFTDISAGFFDKAKKKFSEWNRIEFKTLDIEKDISEQGFTEKYDLVVAANVLHATADLKFAMKNIRSLLRDDGYLLVGELSEDLASANFLWGPLTGWWLRPRSPGRSGPGLSLDEWREELAEDFGSVFEIESRRDKSDNDALSSTIVMMARAKPADYTLPEPLSGEKVHIVGTGSDLSMRDHIKQYLGKRGISATSSNLEDLSSQKWSGGWLILMDEAEGSFLASLRTEQLEVLKSWLTKPIKCIWVTHKVYLDPQNKTGGLVTGFARTIRMENSQLELYTLDLSSEGDGTANIIYHVLERIHYSHDDSISKLDYEVAEKDGQIWTCRLVPDARLENAFGPTRKIEAPATQVVQAPHHLVLGEPGILETLSMAQDDEYLAIPNGHVLIEVRAIGLDERDGRIAEGSLAAIDFGRECSGIVASCAANVTSFSPGDRVAVIGQGTFRTHYLAPSDCCKKIPDWLSFEDAAAIPTSFVTALYALTTPVRVSTGQKILVVNATSSQGIALIKIATALKLDVYATISDRKKSLLTEHGICSSKIFVIPTSASRSNISSATNGQAFKFVFNTRSGQYEEFSHLVANRGTYIEIGLGEIRRDGFYLRPNKNVMFASIDLADAYNESKQDLGKLLNTVIDMVERREIVVDMPVSVAGLNSLKSAFSTLLVGDQHKQVIALTNVDDEQLINTRPKTSCFNEHKAYIITGGLGGLGRAIAVWMASYGARHLILATSSVSRALESSELLQQLSSYGCNARVEVCDVGDFAAVERLVAAINIPVGGVIHSALRLSDRFFEDITLEDFDVVFGPKVNGSLNLHTCLLNHDLDFFVMLSSGCGVLGNEGQSNYSAGSTFLDTFARYRQSLGLAASSIDLGYVEDVGNISDRPEIQASLLSRGLRPITVRDVLRVVEGAIATGSPKNPTVTKGSSYDGFSQSQIVLSFGMIDKTTAEWQSWSKDAKFGLLRSRATDNAAINHNSDSGEVAVQTTVKAFRNTLSRLADVSEGKEAVLQPIVCSALVAKLAQVLSMKIGEIQVTRSAVQYGMDSLIAIDVRSWARYAFQIDLPINDLTNPYSIQDLAARISRMIV
ncbi:Highly reducing polyketide synthase gpy1 [Orbilia oligospora]|uniref:Highly reducing polyketide synthase gpy1 n=1 Tax=Orbilia oligospora TaxID=2813651 RepID=A0A7C8JCL4_ORBOL|nr:Highly reducing polyketide synthase gpy1 [Orbilia oligospora]KAF3109308.1 Highly reducing polyketide synthase gpy1 [Orbilia oligospora]KAF3150480.1 Highly reducing polyketide synthase gpy1 [Orbilia oligospora]